MICQVSGELTFSIERHRLDRSKCARAHTHERPARRASDMHSWALDYSACTHEYIPNLPHKGAHAYTSHGAVRYKNRAVLLCMRPRWAEQSIKVCVRVPQNIYIYIFKKVYPLITAVQPVQNEIKNTRVQCCHLHTPWSSAPGHPL